MISLYNYFSVLVLNGNYPENNVNKIIPQLQISTF